MNAEWVEIARKRGYELHGVSMWVVVHGMSCYSSAKILGVNQPTLWRWLHSRQQDLPLCVCALFRLLNRLDLEKIDSVRCLE